MQCWWQFGLLNAFMPAPDRQPGETSVHPKDSLREESCTWHIQAHMRSQHPSCLQCIEELPTLLGSAQRLAQGKFEQMHAMLAKYKH